MDTQKEYATLMEAYNAVYENQEQLDEDPVQDYRDMKRGKENAAGMRGPELSHSAPTGGSAKQKASKPEPRSREFSHGGSSQPRSREFAHKEEVETDLFDTILEHLVAEGYADTNEAALAIMANMSEEWKQSIVEGNAAIRANVPQPGTRTARMSATGKEPAGDRLVRQAGQAIGKFLGSRGVQKIEPAPPQRKPLVSTTKPGPSNNFGRGF